MKGWFTAPADAIAHHAEAIKAYVTEVKAMPVRQPNPTIQFGAGEGASVRLSFAVGQHDIAEIYAVLTHKPDEGWVMTGGGPADPQVPDAPPFEDEEMRQFVERFFARKDPFVAFLSDNLPENQHDNLFAAYHTYKDKDFPRLFTGVVFRSVTGSVHELFRTVVPSNDVLNETFGDLLTLAAVAEGITEGGPIVSSLVSETLITVTQSFAEHVEGFNKESKKK